MIPFAKSHRVVDHKEHELLKVLSFSDERLGSRLMSMGMLPGTMLTIDKKAPLRGGYCLRINGKKIAVRYDEAASIIVE